MSQVTTQAPYGFGRLVRERRESLGMSQGDLAERTGFGQRRISQIENSRDPYYYPASYEMVSSLARALGLPLTALAEAAGRVDPDPAEPQTIEEHVAALEREINRLPVADRSKAFLRHAVRITVS